MPDALRLDPVGVAHTPYETPAGAPHQGFAGDDEAVVEVFEPFEAALAGLEDVPRVTVVYWADRAERRPATDDGDGAFARRTPHRPNPLSICSCLRLSVDGRRVRLRGLDALDGSPVLDLKPSLRSERS